MNPKEEILNELELLKNHLKDDLKNPNGPEVIEDTINIIKKETRVYWLSSDENFSSDKIETLTKEEKDYFIKSAENEGNVCTLTKFQTELNSETWHPDNYWVLITDEY